MGSVIGVPRILLQAEGLLVLLAATFAYSQTSSGWLFFALLFFVPDVTMAGYLVDRRIGSVIYNLGHTYLTPAALYAAGWIFASPTSSAVALIWIAHIGFDRALTYGLKYASDFKDTHLSSLQSKN